MQVAISVTQRYICKMGPVHCKLASQTAHQFSFAFRQHNFVLLILIRKEFKSVKWGLKPTQ